jgi:hypothetical protein
MASVHTATLAPKRGFHQTYTSHISLPRGNANGLLPTQEVLPDHSESDERQNCTLHVAHALPSAIFVDPYELELRSDSYAFHLWGERNLEYPVHAMPRGGQQVLLDVRVVPGAEEVTVELPLHLRYETPGHGGYQLLSVPWPSAFWACHTTGEPRNGVGFTTRISHVRRYSRTEGLQAVNIATRSR